MVITRADLEGILSRSYVIRPPERILVVDRPLVGIEESPHFKHSTYHHGGLTVKEYRGAQPSFRSDVIVLAPSANDETVFHEWAHTKGAGELLAYPIGRIMAMRNRISPFRHRDIGYEESQGASELLRQIGITVPQGANPKLFLRR